MPPNQPILGKHHYSKHLDEVGTSKTYNIMSKENMPREANSRAGLSKGIDMEVSYNGGTWRIIPLSNWLITPVSKSPFSRVIPSINGLELWLFTIY